MARDEIKLFLGAVRKEIEKARQRFEETHQSANEVSVISTNSPSQSGDRFHSRNQAELNREVLENLKKAEKELLESLDCKPLIIKAPCYIELQETNGNLKKIYLLLNALNIVGFMAVSIKSPLGGLLLGKKVGERVNFASGELKILIIN